jgi:hypothetical protein
MTMIPQFLLRFYHAFRGHYAKDCIDIGPLEKRCLVCGQDFGLWDFYP